MSIYIAEVSLPADLCESLAEFQYQAITEAREECPTFCIPANWSAELIRGELGGGGELVFKVIRESNGDIDYTALTGRCENSTCGKLYHKPDGILGGRSGLRGFCSDDCREEAEEDEELDDSGR